MYVREVASFNAICCVGRASHHLIIIVITPSLPQHNPINLNTARLELGLT